MKLEQYNRHLSAPFESLDALKKALEESYQRTRSSALTGKEFGGVTNITILNWLKQLGIPHLSRGGPNYKGKGVAEKINAMDQSILEDLYSDQIASIFEVSTRYIHGLKARKKITCNYKHRTKKWLWKGEI